MDIREVARRAGVSMATVSRALNNRGEVSPTTRQRVLEIADELGYRPNISARTLVRRRSDTVGLIWDTTWITHGRSQPFLQEVLVGIKIALDEAGYHLTLLSTHDESEGAFARAARQHSLDGVILMGVDARHPAVASLVNGDIPSVGFDLDLHGPMSSWVGSDNARTAALAVDHLAGLGHTRIATITGPLTMLAASDRLAGFHWRMGELHLSVPEHWVESGDFFHDSGVEAMRRILDSGDVPTAVFAASDEMAIGAMRAVLDAGLRVPEDVSIVGVDDLEAAALVRPRLTTMAQDHLTLGRTLVSRLTELIDRRRELPSESWVPLGPILIDTQLLARESTGPAPAA